MKVNTSAIIIDTLNKTKDYRAILRMYSTSVRNIIYISSWLYIRATKTGKLFVNCYDIVCCFHFKKQVSTTRKYKKNHAEILTIQHGCPCRIEIYHPRGRNLNKGRGLLSPWQNSNPEGEISLSYMDRLMMDCFSPTFRRFFCQNIKTKKKTEKNIFFIVDLHYFRVHECFIGL